MKTLDLRTLGVNHPAVVPLSADLQQIELRALTISVRNNQPETVYTLFAHKRPEGWRLWIDKSLKYVSHSTRLGVYGPPLLQLSLAMCLRLYPVSRAINFHRTFAGQYLISLPEGDFSKRLIVPL